MQGNIQNKVLDSLNKYHVDKLIVGSNQSVQANPSRADKQNQLKDNILGLQTQCRCNPSSRSSPTHALKPIRAQYREGIPTGTNVSPRINSDHTPTQIHEDPATPTRVSRAAAR